MWKLVTFGTLGPLPYSSVSEPFSLKRDKNERRVLDCGALELVPARIARSSGKNCLSSTLYDGVFRVQREKVGIYETVRAGNFCLCCFVVADSAVIVLLLSYKLLQLLLLHCTRCCCYGKTLGYYSNILTLRIWCARQRGSQKLSIQSAQTEKNTLIHAYSLTHKRSQEKVVVLVK